MDSSRRGPGWSPEAERVVRGLRAITGEAELYVGAAGREATMHRTDLTGLAVVMDRGAAGSPVTPGQLSAALGLSAPATSAMLDRLERLGHVRRSRHPDDRRSVVVEMTDHAREVGAAMFGRLGAHMGPVLGARTDEELRTIASFLEDAAEAHRAARQEIEER